MLLRAGLGLISVKGGWGVNEMELSVGVLYIRIVVELAACCLTNVVQESLYLMSTVLSGGLRANLNSGYACSWLCSSGSQDSGRRWWW